MPIFSDALGNRTQMVDLETGTTNYQYDELSRITTEQKILRSDWSLPNHTYNIQYAYNLAGQLASVTDPFGERIDYKADKLGRLEQITGTPYSAGGNTGSPPVTNYIDDIDYRAWGAVKQISYGNGVRMSQEFNNRLQVSQFEVLKTAQTAPIIKKNYEYYNDGEIKFSDDTSTGHVIKDQNKFDRSYKYDFAGRLTQATTGVEARGGVATDRNEVPYKRDYTYNAFSNVTARKTYTWTQQDDKTQTWVNNRVDGWSYDSDGRLKSTGANTYYYDAAGQTVMSTLYYQRRVIMYRDGDRRAVRKSDYRWRSYSQYTLESSDYYIYSTVLGAELTQISNYGAKKKTSVYGVNGVVATQNRENTFQTVRWDHQDPLNQFYVETAANGEMWAANSPAELDPENSDVGVWNQNPEGNFNAQAPGTRWGDPHGGMSCRLDGFEMPCGIVFQVLSSGAGYIDWNRSNHFTLGQLGIFRGRGICEDWDYLCKIGEVRPRSFRECETINLPMPSDALRQALLRSIYEEGLRQSAAISQMIKDMRCDAYLSRLFGDAGAYFFDHIRYGIAPVTGGIRYNPATGVPYGDHSHLYGSATDSSVSSGVYVPSGGVLIQPPINRRDRGNPNVAFYSDGMGRAGNFVQYYYSRLGNLSNVILFVYHVFNFRV